MAGTKKKKSSAETVFGLLPKLYCEKKNFVLQENECIVREQLLGCEMGCKKKKSYCNTLSCIAIGTLEGLEKLYCIGIVLQESVLQHKDIGFSCIAIRWDGWAGSVLQYTGLYCREEGRDCIAIQSTVL